MRTRGQVACPAQFGSGAGVCGDGLLEERPVVVPVCGRGCRDDDTAAVGALDEAGDLPVMVSTDSGDVVVEDTRSCAVEEGKVLGVCVECGCCRVVVA